MNDQTMYSTTRKTTHALLIEVWYRGKLADDQRTAVVNSIAKTAIENTRNINDYSVIRITIKSAYDIGIASGNMSVWYGKTVENWRKEIDLNGPSTRLLPAMAGYRLLE